MSCVHDPRSGQKGHMIWAGSSKGGSARTARVAIGRRGDDIRFADEED